MTLTTGIFFAHQWFLLLGVGWLMMRLWTLRRTSVTVVTIIAVGVFVLFCVNYQQRVDRATLNGPQETELTVRVYPDQLKVNGDQFQMLARTVAGHQQVQVYGRIKSLAMQQQLLHVNKTATWQLKGTLEPISIATNDNQFNAQQYARIHHVYNQMTVEKVVTARPAPSSGINRWFDWCHELRFELMTYFDTMPHVLRLYCHSLIIGNVLNDFSDTMTGVTQLGLIHLFSISGMHVFLVVSMIRTALVYLWIEKETVNRLLIGVLPVYLIIGGGSTGLMRATLMAEITLICQSERFHLSKIDIWSLSLAGGLIYQPLLLLTLGGQLSYLLALMLHFLPSGKPLTGAVLMNLIGLPSILYYIYEWHVLSLLASYLMIPFFSAVIFPLVIGCCFTYWAMPMVGQMVNVFLMFMQQLIDFIGALPGMIHFGKPPIAAIAILFSVTLLVYVFPHRRRAWGVLVLIYVFTFGWIHFPLYGEVVFFDIGQGDSFLIREPFNRSVTMIDTGGQLNFPKPQWAQSTTTNSRAKRVSINYLKSQGISQIDNLCLSHQDTDHIGYTEDILAAIHVRQISFPKGMERQRNFKTKVLPLARKQHSRLIPVVANDHLPALPLRVVHPFTSGKGANEDSMVLTGIFGGLRFMFMGDLDRNGEKEILARYPELKTDVLKLGHHGSKTASDPAFIKGIQPRLAIISAGRMNRYGHPNNETMNTLKRQRIQAISTQQYGMIRYRYWNNTRHAWDTKLKGDELKWMLPPYSNS